MLIKTILLWPAASAPKTIWHCLEKKLLICFASSLDIEAGQFTDSEILVMLGENGTGKTTFIRMLAGKLDPDAGSGEAFIKTLGPFDPRAS